MNSNYEKEKVISLVKEIAPTLNFRFPYSAQEWVENKNLMVENYHKHTTWSNLVQIDSATLATDFMRELENKGCRLFFSGEHGFQGEWVYIYDLCKQSENKDFREKTHLKEPIKFRYSTEAYWVKDRATADSKNCHIVLVARTYKGIRKINYILSEAHTNGFYYKPRIDLELLLSLNPEDVFVTSACLAGWKYEDSEEIWLKIWKHFGDSFFLEYQAHDTPRQIEINKKILAMSEKYGIQTIVGLDTHYISEEDKVKRDKLLQRKKLRYDDEDGWYMDFPTGNELLGRLSAQGVLSLKESLRAMMNTHIFLEGCSDISLNTEFKIPILPKYKKYSYEQRCKELETLLQTRYEKEENKDTQREKAIEYELGEIVGSHTVDYFLTNHELVKKAISNYGGQITPTSRGSASSYYTSKLLGFTTMDRFEAEVPIYPERFITKERILSSHQVPDIDINVSKQEPFVLAGKDICGEHGCYPLLAVGKLGEKSGFKLYADTEGLEPTVANDISKCIDSYNEALKQVDDENDKKFIEIEDYITDKHHLKIFNDSKPYQGIIEQAKCHACGFLLFSGDTQNLDVEGFGDIRYEIGLIRCFSESTQKTTIVACIEGNLLDSYGYVKDDFLIVDVVSIIYKLYERLGCPVPTVSELRKMVMNDEKVWSLYANGTTCCLNQCERTSTTKKIMRFKPQNIKELAAFIAGIRPGFKSLIEGFLNRVEYTNGEKVIDELLSDSFSYMLYQEAVMKIFSYLGIPMKDSYDTIKKISKKKLKGEALQRVEETLKNHWLDNIGNLDNFEPVYKVIKDSARYSFNAPHALSMACDSLYEAWVKAHYPHIFYEVTLNHYQEKLDKNKVAELLKEAKTFYGYKSGAFEYGKDNSKFTIDETQRIIYPNLSSVKGIGSKAVQDLMDIYHRGVTDFIDIYSSIVGTNVNKTIFRNLIKIGYFKEFGSVKKLLEIVDIYDKWKNRSTISKAAIVELGLSNIDLHKYATDVTKTGKISSKQYTNLDFVGLVRELSSKLPNDEYGSCKLGAMEYEVLGYTNIVDPEISKRFVLVMDLDTTWSPRFIARSFNNGKVAELKVHKKINKKDKTIKTSFEEIPFENGDVLYLNDIKKENKRVNINGKWQKDPNTIEWWVKDYYKIEVS